MQTTARKLRKLGHVTFRPLRADATGHALGAFVAGHTEPVGHAQIERIDGARAVITLKVDDRYHGSTLGRALVELLSGDARAAGISSISVVGADAVRSPTWASPVRRSTPLFLRAVRAARSA